MTAPYLNYSLPLGVAGIQRGMVLEIPNERGGWEPYRVTVSDTRPCSSAEQPGEWAWGLDQAGRGRLVRVSAPQAAPAAA